MRFLSLSNVGVLVTLLGSLALARGLLISKAEALRLGSSYWSGGTDEDRIPRAVVRSVFMRERDELAQRILRYRDEAPLPSLAGRIVVLVDDGLASGATLRAAGMALRIRRRCEGHAAVRPRTAQIDVLRLPTMRNKPLIATCTMP